MPFTSFISKTTATPKPAGASDACAICGFQWRDHEQQGGYCVRGEGESREAFRDRRLAGAKRFADVLMDAQRSGLIVGTPNLAEPDRMTIGQAVGKTIASRLAKERLDEVREAYVAALEEQKRIEQAKAEAAKRDRDAQISALYQRGRQWIGIDDRDVQEVVDVSKDGTTITVSPRSLTRPPKEPASPAAPPMGKGRRYFDE